MVKATPRSLYSRERPGTHFIGSWVGPRAGKSRPPPGFHPRTVKPVVFLVHNELKNPPKTIFSGMFVIVILRLVCAGTEHNLVLRGNKQIPTVSKQNNTNTDMFARNNEEMTWVCERSLAGIVGSNPAGSMNALSGEGLCDGPIICLEESYHV